MPLLAGLEVLHAIQLHLITSDASAFHLLRMHESLLLKKHLYAQTQRSSLNPSHHTWNFIIEDVCTQVNIRSLSRWLSRQQDQTLHRATRLIANPDLPPPLNSFHLQAFLSCFFTSCPFILKALSSTSIAFLYWACPASLLFASPSVHIAFHPAFLFQHCPLMTPIPLFTLLLWPCHMTPCVSKQPVQRCAEPGPLSSHLCAKHVNKESAPLAGRPYGIFDFSLFESSGGHINTRLSSAPVSREAPRGNHSHCF